MLYPPARSGSSFTVPASVKIIAGGAFAGSALEEIIFPEGITEIGGSAFYGATKLKTVSMPESLTSIGSYAFLNCTSLEEIVIPDGVTEIGTFLFEAVRNFPPSPFPPH